MAARSLLRDSKEVSQVTDTKELLTAIERRYDDAGFAVQDVTGTNGLVLQNAFSIQAVFVVENDVDLRDRWADLHEELIEAYRSYDGFVDMEWNFYCVFVLLESGESADLQKLRRVIESDTSYSRKFVLLRDEVHQLPPGRIDEPGGSHDVDQGDLLGEWRSALGDELLEQICEASFAQMKDMLATLVREEAARDD